MSSPVDRLLRRRRAADPADVELAQQLDARRAAARVAEAELLAALAPEATAGATPEQVRTLRRRLDARLAAAVESAEAAYRIALGPVDGLSRVRLLARLRRPAVGEADRARRQLAIARTHYRVQARDDLGTVRLAGVDPATAGTAASFLATREGH